LLQAGITNGDFSADLTNGWTIESGYVNWWADSSARLAPDYDKDTFFLHSTLSQVFTMDAGSMTLYFDLTMEAGEGETDVFTASLLDSTDVPLISIGGGKDYFFSLSSEGDIEKDDLVTITGDITNLDMTVALDVSGLALPCSAKIVFDLAHDYGDDVDTYAFLDNVNVSLIPTPGAFVLGSIGVGFVTWLRRRRTF
jgi:hypothetical protein